MNGIGALTVKIKAPIKIFITCIKSFHIVHTLYGRFKKDRFEKVKNNLQCRLSPPQTGWNREKKQTQRGHQKGARLRDSYY